MMEQLIRFYEQYGMYLDGFFTYIHILVLVIIGMAARNVIDDKVEISGIKLPVIAIFLSLLLVNAGSWLNEKVLGVTSLIFGFGAHDLLKKWIRLKIWNKYDFLSKGNGTRSRKKKKDEDKDDNEDNENTEN